jgi:NAD(P)-dependent dehydrogenase (short-subunit alcohol dehydrogenase family)
MTAVVTGGGSMGTMPGSGAAISILFASEGAKIVIVDADRRRAEHTVEAAAFNGVGGIEPFPADITQAGECEAAVRSTVERFGGIDVLVNNAAIAPEELGRDDDRWDRIVDLNLRAVMLMTESVLPGMRAGGGGAIVNISSVATVIGGGGPAYTATKAGVAGYTQAIAYREGLAGIRANEVLPGHLAMPLGLGINGDRRSEDEDGRRRRADASLLGTEGDAWDVAYACLYLASREARYITGVRLPVDGGATAALPIAMADRITAATGGAA